MLFLFLYIIKLKFRQKKNVTSIITARTAKAGTLKNIESSYYYVSWNVKFTKQNNKYKYVRVTTRVVNPTKTIISNTVL